MPGIPERCAVSAHVPACLSVLVKRGTDIRTREFLVSYAIFPTIHDFTWRKLWRQRKQHYHTFFAHGPWVEIASVHLIVFLRNCWHNHFMCKMNFGRTRLCIVFYQKEPKIKSNVYHLRQNKSCWSFLYELYYDARIDEHHVGKRLLLSDCWDTYC